MLVVGSAALAVTGRYIRKPNDVDVLCTSDEFKSLAKKVLQDGYRFSEIKYTESGGYFRASRKGTELIVDASFTDLDHPLAASDLEIIEYSKNTSNFVCCVDGIGPQLIAPPEMVLLMKMSHRFKKDSAHFLKTREDIMTLRDYWGEGEPSGLTYWASGSRWKEMLDRREKATYNNKLPKLNTTKSSFFTDSVPYKYDHDTIHEAVKHLDKPAYQYYMKDGEQVMCDMQKFMNGLNIVRLYGVLEESYVLALERAIIPFDTHPKRAFDIALEKVCTSITSGVFREFAWENYDIVQGMYHESFVTKFNTALADGKILPYQGEMHAAKSSSNPR